VSLKAFHVVFVLAAAALSAWFAVWAFSAYRSGGGAGSLALALASALTALALVVYLPRFLAKTKGLGP